MATADPSPIPFPVSSFPGANPQEGAGRLINCYAEPLGDPQGPASAPAAQVWRRAPGLSQFASTAQSGYRGGLIVGGSSYEVWANQAATVSGAGVVSLLGTFPGTKKVSIARDQASPNPDVVAVDIDNGAYQLSGGGAPTHYTGGGNLPSPNSVAFQDSYFFFTIGSGQVYASGQNALTQNALTFITIQAKADVNLLRGIAYSGLMLFFTTGSCEVWQDVANPAPAFPYGRLTVLEYGLIQANAIAGWETGFSNLMWVAQDFGVYLMMPGTLAPQKVSPPDLDRLIEAQVVANNTFDAGCYIFGGKKFWHLSSPAWTWEFNLATAKWNERQSLNTSGVYGRWRATGGHPAFGKWLIGDQNSGKLLFVDDQNFTEVGSPQLFRVESGPVKTFPGRVRIARADFDFDMGVGIAVGNFVMMVTGAAAGAGGVVRLAVTDTSRAATNDTAIVANVGGTTEANGTWLITVVDATHIELKGTTFVHAWTSGGTATDVTSPASAVAPTVAISRSLDGALTFGNPRVRSLGQQGRSKRTRASVKAMGLSGPMGDRWRLDVTDPVYVGLMGGTQSSNPREVGA